VMINCRNWSASCQQISSSCDFAMRPPGGRIHADSAARIYEAK
jgi:hypothetical protein